MTTYKEAGPDYCRNHSGIREEDEDYCDFAGTCRRCSGSGFRNEDDDCEACEGTGRAACDLTPLLYEVKSDG